METLRADLADLVNSDTTLTGDDLESVSAIGMGFLLTADVIAGLRLESENDQAILMNRLADEIALQRQVEKMLMLRHVLQTARQDPDVAVNEPAVEQITVYLTRIQEDLDEILWERSVRKEIGSSTAAVIAERYALYRIALSGEGIDATNRIEPLNQTR